MRKPKAATNVENLFHKYSTEERATTIFAPPANSPLMGGEFRHWGKLRHPNQIYTIQSHRMSHDVVHQTTRTDLLNLVAWELLQAKKADKTWRFTPTVDLEEKLAKMG